MLGLFRPRCPLDIREKVWTEQRMRWLADRFGLERMLNADIVLPTHDFFPDPYEGTSDNVRGLLDRVCHYMHVDPQRIDLKFYAAQEMPNAVGLYERGEGATIHVADSQLEDQERLIATLAHEVAHDLLLRDGMLTGAEDDHERVTDLLTAFLGMGIFAANTTVQQRSEVSVGWEYWSISKQGYLPARVYGYAFALMAWVRGETRPTWAAYVGQDALGTFKKGLRYLRKTADSLFCPDPLCHTQSEPSLADLLAELRGSSDTRRVAALWHLREDGRKSNDAVGTVLESLSHREPAVRCEVAETLAAIAEPTQEVVHALMSELRTADAEFCACLVTALGTLHPPLETLGPDGSTFREELSVALTDSRRAVVHATAKAISSYGEECRDLAPLLLPSLKRTLVHCDYGNIGFLLRNLTAILPAGDAFLQENLARQDRAHRKIALEALRRLDADST